jgi:hypothetical protein
MDGFITESVGKISDGFLNAIKLLLLYGLIKLVLNPIQELLPHAILVIVVFVLLAFAAFALYRSQADRISDHTRAWRGMAAGGLFWFAFLLVTEMGEFVFFDGLGIIFWLMLGLIGSTLWRRVLPIGARMGLLVFLTCWMGRIYLGNISLTATWLPVLTFAYRALRYVAGACGLAAIFYVVFRSRNAADRGYAAIVIFNAVLYILSGF